MSHRDRSVLAALRRLAVGDEVCAYLGHIARAAGCSNHTVRRSIAVLIAGGEVEHVGRRGQVAVYRLARSCSTAAPELATGHTPQGGDPVGQTSSNGGSAVAESTSADPAELAAEAERIKAERERDELADRPLTDEERTANLARAERLMFRFADIDLEPVAVDVGVCDDHRPYSPAPNEPRGHGEPTNRYQLGPGRFCRDCFASRLKVAQRYQPDIVEDLVARARRTRSAAA